MVTELIWYTLLWLRDRRCSIVGVLNLCVTWHPLIDNETGTLKGLYIYIYALEFGMVFHHRLFNCLSYLGLLPKLGLHAILESLHLWWTSCLCGCTSFFLYFVRHVTCPILCTFFVHYFFKSTIKFIGSTFDVQKLFLLFWWME
jgi:hypothetical protein